MSNEKEKINKTSPGELEKKKIYYRSRENSEMGAVEFKENRQIGPE